MDLRLERASILFNTGSVKSHIAASADRAQAEGLKVACKEFQVRRLVVVVVKGNEMLVIGRVSNAITTMG